MTVVTPIVIFASWFLLTAAPAGRLAIEDARAGVPKEKRRGVSVFLGFPLMPLLAWGAIAAADYFIGPWGSRIGLVAHLIMFAICAAIIVRDVYRLRGIKP